MNQKIVLMKSPVVQMNPVNPMKIVRKRTGPVAMKVWMMTPVLLVRSWMMQNVIKLLFLLCSMVLIPLALTFYNNSRTAHNCLYLNYLYLILYKNIYYGILAHYIVPCIRMYLYIIPLLLRPRFSAWMGQRPSFIHSKASK